MKDLRILLLLVVCIGSCVNLYAHHGKGGDISYVYLGAGSAAGTSEYRITIQHYINCERISDEPGQVYLGIFDQATNSLVNTITIVQQGKTEIIKGFFNPCINPAPTVCYYLVTYTTKVTLTDNTGGYTLAEQDCCRADEIINISDPSGTGFTNVNSIPGVINGVVYRVNSSPILIFKDTAVICHNSSFFIDMGATDQDGDALTYAFCSAKATGSSTRQPNPPSAPPYSSVIYTTGFSGAAPLGAGVNINPTTGLISGIAPAASGDYAITVCITETRNGVDINVTKKEVLVTVADCSLSAATLDPSYINCDNYTFTFKNNTTSNVTNYYWDFGVAGISTDTSTQASPAYTYSDTGSYLLKLKVSNATGCVDSTSAVVKVYPGFEPDFTVAGSCYQSAFQFKDASVTKYGAINAWRWNFGDLTTTADTSTVKNPSYLYPSPDSVTVTFNVSSDKGCNGIITKIVAVTGKPDIYLPFTDTLVCSIDSLPLIVKSTNGASFQWTPGYDIINPSTTNPIVYPKATTRYTVTVFDKGCVDSASVTVNVLDYITVTLPADTTVCLSDSFTLNPVSQALLYQWTPAQGLSNAFIKSPKVSPAANTTYQVIAHLGKCQVSASIRIRVVPYPKANAGADTSICFGTSANLNGSIVASFYAWSPTSFLSQSQTLHPGATPLSTTSYLLSVRDTLGCPKTVADTVTITVIPPVKVFAGNDTSIVIGQPLQLNAISNINPVNFTWSPVTGINNTAIANPVITIRSAGFNYITYLVTAATPEGCAGTDSITVKIFNTPADIFIPTAFTPNNDGKNDVFKPILIGISSLDFFRVYNRWGQLVYETRSANDGWDGYFHGVPQDTGNFIFVAKAKDYTGKVIFKKGSVMLIR